MTRSASGKSSFPTRPHRNEAFSSTSCTPNPWYAPNKRSELTAAAKHDVPIHLQAPETEFVTKTTGVGSEHLVAHKPGDQLHVGDIALDLIHTPGHTPGSQCILVEGHLVSGDTLFLDGCGRTDLPGGDAATLYHSINSGLAGVSDDVILCPGHQYSPKPTQTMGETRANNIVYRPDTAEQWLAMFN